MPDRNECIFVDNNKQYMYTPANQTSQAEMVIVPPGFTNKFRAAYKEWMNCQEILTRAMTGQDNDSEVFRSFDS